MEARVRVQRGERRNRDINGGRVDEEGPRTAPGHFSAERRRSRSYVRGRGAKSRGLTGSRWSTTANTSSSPQCRSHELQDGLIAVGTPPRDVGRITSRGAVAGESLSTRSRYKLLRKRTAVATAPPQARVQPRSADSGDSGAWGSDSILTPVRERPPGRLALAGAR